MKIAISWSGGMESALACHKAIEEGHDVAYLVVFVSETWPAFCHPLSIMELQARALKIPLLRLAVKEPYEKSYREVISHLLEKKGIEGIVTGDIYVVDDLHGRWMDKVTEGLDISVIMPLWNQDTNKVLNEEIACGFRSVFTCLGRQWFSEEWLGRELNKNSVPELKALAKESGMDLCGENGEYHTMTIDGPIFKKRIEISRFSKEKHNNRLFIKINEYFLKVKNL
ncbi:MAG: diphthine--ammonia ligase [Candidatus Bathyarchaeota archaeon]|nr:diphthine--ammonia ligase [Candidatus Bathyarchaeota archaeon]